MAILFYCVPHKKKYSIFEYLAMQKENVSQSFKEALLHFKKQNFCTKKKEMTKYTVYLCDCFRIWKEYLNCHRNRRLLYRYLKCFAIACNGMTCFLNQGTDNPKDQIKLQKSTLRYALNSLEEHNYLLTTFTTRCNMYFFYFMFYFNVTEY